MGFGVKYYIYAYDILGIFIDYNNTYYVWAEVGVLKLPKILPCKEIFRQVQYQKILLITFDRLFFPSL